jgi:tripartite-type tricarboxylate transporter receptor subunit TctC
MKSSTVLKKWAIAALLAAGLAGAAQAQDWRPDGPVKLIAPVAPGTASDTIARYFAEAFGKEWRVPVVIENRVGANGILGAEAVAKAPSDGRTLLVVSSPHYINKSIYARLLFDPVKDFTAIAGFSTACLVLGLCVTTQPARPHRSF